MTKGREGNKYPDGKQIPKALPKAYALGNNLKNCSNCLFYQQKYCTFWGANVRGAYLCAKWKSKQGLENPGGSAAMRAPQTSTSSSGSSGSSGY
tara:strand:- start:2562 stop:2843 length:282 start_codon:yes stop_codon:yes gene_type:complete